MRTHLAGVVATAAVLMTPLVAHARSVEGTPGPDKLKGTPQDDVVTAYGGDDVVRSLGGADLVYAMPGDDVVHGGKGPDRLHGGLGADRMDGGPRRDVLIGDEGDDRLLGRGAGRWNGNFGDDRIVIAYPAGADTRVHCGGGTDVLIFNEPYDDVSITGCETVKVVSAG